MRSKITEITKGKSEAIYTKLLENLSYSEPHEFIGTGYSKYQDENPNNPSINGRIFEYLICETLAHENIIPFYYQAKFTLIPNADFDVVLYKPKAPIVLTMKTSLRERYKQADLEGIALQQVYRRARSYLITLSNEAKGIKNKISEGDITGIYKCIVASNREYTDLLTELRQQSFEAAKEIMPLTGSIHPVSIV